MPDPIAFMVMPYGRRPTGRSEAGIPAEVDFDALWLDVYSPVLQGLGYRTVRADADLGSLIISEMIQRLVLGDLVVADLTLPNANVYYEVGVRHAARKTGCVLVAAEWARPLFDLAQMRQVRFPLADGRIGKPAAITARAHLAEGLRPMTHTTSPVFDSLPGYPADQDPQRASAFADLADELMAFDAAVRETYLAPVTERRARALDVLARFGDKPAVREADALALLYMLRDLAGWADVLRFIATLPQQFARHERVMEIEYLAIAKTGSAIQAVARLEALIARYGETSERLGLLGGRYKQLADEAADEGERRRFLDKAIGSYERGMMTDLNDYYPASNLPRLYRQRGRQGDEQLAVEAEIVTMAACRRALLRQTADEWIRATLLGLAFDRGDVAEAQRLLPEVAADGVAAWKVETTIADLEKSASGHAEDKVRRQLHGILSALRELIAPGMSADKANRGDEQEPR